MSKKKKYKKKFKAQLHQALQEIERQQPSVATPVEERSSLRDGTEELKNLETVKPRNLEIEKQEATKIEKPRENIPQKQSEAAPPTVDKEKEIEKVSNEYAHVKKDVLKIVVIVAICVVILIAIWILSLKTNYISDFANSLANFSHLSQGK